jgi:RND superfamily putative drug exporter
MGERWAGFVTRCPLRTVAVGVIALLVLAIPLVSLRLALADSSSAATNTTQCKAYDLISTEFGSGFNGPLTLLVQTQLGGNPAKAALAVAATVETLPDVLTVTRRSSATTAAPPSCPSSPAAACTTPPPPTSSRPSAPEHRRSPRPTGRRSR